MLTKKHIICKRVLMTNLMFTDGLTSGIIFQLFITKNDDFSAQLRGFISIEWLCL
jgi:hypothetical protein